MTDPTPLEMDFHQAMLAIYRKAKEDCSYNATRFLQLVANDGRLKTAMKLLATNDPSDGFTELWKNHHLDLTVENLVLNHKHQILFSSEEISVAQDRLRSYGFLKNK